MSGLYPASVFLPNDLYHLFPIHQNSNSFLHIQLLEILLLPYWHKILYDSEFLPHCLQMSELKFSHIHHLPILSSLNLLILLALTIFIYLKTRAESDRYRSIWYRIADKWVHFIKHPCCLLYKGYFPSDQLWWWTFRVYGVVLEYNHRHEMLNKLYL